MIIDGAGGELGWSGDGAEERGHEFDVPEVELCVESDRCLDA